MRRGPLAPAAVSRDSGSMNKARHRSPPSKLKLPHERDESVGAAGRAPRKIIEQARRDLEAGLVDTDMRATPGLDARRRRRLVKSG
jgi:hypothetical protein